MAVAESEWDGMGWDARRTARTRGTGDLEPEAFWPLDTDLVKSKGKATHTRQVCWHSRTGQRYCSALRNAHGISGTAEQRSIFAHRGLSDRLLPRRRVHAPRGALTCTHESATRTKIVEIMLHKPLRFAQADRRHHFKYCCTFALPFGVFLLFSP